MRYTTATQNPVAKNSGTPLFLLQIAKDIQPQRAQNCLTLILGQADLQLQGPVINHEVAIPLDQATRDHVIH